MPEPEERTLLFQEKYGSFFEKRHTNHNLWARLYVALFSNPPTDHDRVHAARE